MENYKITAWFGETIPIEVAWDTDIAATATLLIQSDTAIVYEKTIDFVNNVANLDVPPEDAIGIGVGTFNWLIKINYPLGEVDIIPAPPTDCDCSDAEGNCPKPELEICGVVS